MVEVAVAVWAASPQRAVMAIDRFMSLRLVSGPAIARWVFGSAGVRSLDDEVAGGLAWDLLYAAVDKTLARTQVRLPIRGLKFHKHAGRARESGRLLCQHWRNHPLDPFGGEEGGQSPRDCIGSLARLRHIPTRL